MKKLLVTLTSILVFITVNAQNVYYDYQDGLVVFQLKEDAKIINTINDKSRQVDFRNMSLFRVLSEFEIIEVLRLHPNVSDKKLCRTYQIQVQDIYSVDEVIRILNTHSAIEYAEKKELHRTFLTPNDLGPINSNNSGTSPSNNQWSLHKIQAQLAWDLSIGDANIIVAVTDDAFLMDHEDLMSKYVNPYDAVNQTNDPSPCGFNNGNHGTHVAGIVGAETNNSLGIASIGYNISVMPIKIGNCSNQLTHGYEGITYAASNGAHVVNLSWGGGGFSNYGQNVCDFAWSQGTIIVAAAGNYNDSYLFYPAAYNNVISVASLTPTDSKSGFSQYGTWVNISAPGDEIRSAFATSPSAYVSISGTSMAAPLVAGLLGLMKSLAPNATNIDLINCLYSGADNIDIANPWFVGQLGAGRINAYNSMICASQYAYEFDAGITAILSPDYNMCDGNFSPIVTLHNFGSQTLTSCIINFGWDGNIQSFNWDGNLSSGSSINVTLPELSLSNGSYIFSAFTSFPNGLDDENQNNDSSFKNIIIDNSGQMVSLTLLTDCFGSETTWQISNDFDQEIMISGGPYIDNTQLLEQTYSFCLAIGCYDFIIFDSSGDGLNGSSQQGCNINGDYFMEHEDGSNIFTMTSPNANFGFSSVHSFCIIAPDNFNDAGITALVAPQAFSCSQNVIPVVKLRNYGLNNLNSVDISYSLNAGTLYTFNWLGNLPSGQTADITLPAIPSSDGLVSFSAYSSNPNGFPDYNNNNDTLVSVIQINTTTFSLPFFESFESDVITNGTWRVINPDGAITWSLSPVGGNTPGNQAMKLDFFNYTQSGERDKLISPRISLNGFSSASLNFEHAYRRFNQSATDSLIVYVSNDCGETWVRIMQVGENGSGTFATNSLSQTSFSPALPLDWCIEPWSFSVPGSSCYNLNLSNFLGDDIFIMFESYNAGSIGNNLFIDNINIEGTQIQGFPEVNFSFSNSIICEGENVQFTDISGPEILSRLWDFPGGAPSYSTLENPVISYDYQGAYDVSLSVSNVNGSNSITQNNLIIVYPKPQSPIIVQSGNELSVDLQLGQTASWYINGVQLSNNESFSIDTAGNYYVQVTNSFGCMTQSDNFNVLNLEKINPKVFWNIYPNPSDGLINIVFYKPEIVKISIFDALGRKIIELESTDESLILDLRHLSSGIYSIVAHSENEVFINKLQKIE